MIEHVALALRGRYRALAVMVLGIWSLTGAVAVAGPVGALFQVRVNVVTSCDVVTGGDDGVTQDCNGGHAGNTTEGNHIADDEQVAGTAPEHAPVDDGAKVITITF